MKKTCPFCGKVIESLNKKQLDFNYLSHIGICKKAHKNRIMPVFKTAWEIYREDLKNKGAKK